MRCGLSFGRSRAVMPLAAAALLLGASSASGNGFGLFHGWNHHGWGYSVRGFGTAPMAPTVPMFMGQVAGTTGMVNTGTVSAGTASSTTLSSGTSTAPGFVPMIAPTFSGAGYYTGYYQPVAAPIAPTFAAGLQPSRQMAPSTYLAGYDPDQPAAPLSSAAVVGISFGARILADLLNQAGSGAITNQNGLFNRAVEFFGQSTGFNPNTADQTTLMRIVNKALQLSGLGGVSPGGVIPAPTPVTGQTAGGSTITITISITAPPGTTVNVQPGNTGTTSGVSTPPPPAPGDNPSDVSGGPNA